MALLLVAGTILSYRLPLSAQVVVEEEVTTDTIDIFATEEDKLDQKKSPRLAMWANLLVPGLGHQYIGKQKRAFGYFTAEALFIFGMVFSERYSKKMFENSRSYAWKYGATKCTKDPDNEYWKIIGNKYYMGYEQFNNEMELIDQTDKKYVEPDETWYWEDEYYQETYRDIRKTSTRLHIISSFFLGAMILNRAVSFIDVRIASKYRTVQSKNAKIDIQPHYSLLDREVGLSLTKNF